MYIFGVGIFLLLQLPLYAFVMHVAKAVRSIIFPRTIVNSLVFVVSLGLAGASFFLIRLLLLNESSQQTLSLMFFTDIQQMNIWHFVMGMFGSFIVMLFLTRRMYWNNYLQFVWLIITTVIIFCLTIGFDYTNLYDTSNYAGPINDLLLGKPLLTSRSQYGLIPILLLSLLFRFIPLTSIYFVFSVAVFQFIFFMIFYYVLYGVLRDTRWAFIGTVVTIFSKHLVSDGATYRIPQQSYLRLGSWLLIPFVMFIFDRFFTQHKRIYSLVVPIVVGLNFFWTFDFGLYAIGAYVIFLGILYLSLHWKYTCVKLLQKGMVVAATILIVVISISCISFLVYHTWPMWTTHYFSSSSYMSSNHMLSVPHVPMLWLYIMPFVMVISYALYRKITVQQLCTYERGILFIACIGITTFTYFLGRSTLDRLNTLSTPCIACSLFLLQRFFDRLKRMPKALHYGAILCVSVAMSLPVTLLGYHGAKVLATINPNSTWKLLHFTSEHEFGEYWFYKEAQEIQSKYHQELINNRLTMLSMWETWMFVAFQKLNQSGINCIGCYYLNDNVDFIIQNILSSPSKFLFVDKDRWQGGDEVVNIIFTRIQDNYEYVETIGIFEVYKKK